VPAKTDGLYGCGGGDKVPGRPNPVPADRYAVPDDKDALP
jgi:hypothetical protein